MHDLNDWFWVNGPSLAAGTTVLLSLGCLGVWRLRSPAQRQLAGALGIAGTLAWLILACAPLPQIVPRSLQNSLRPVSEGLAEVNQWLAVRITDPGIFARPSAAALGSIQTVPAAGQFAQGADSPHGPTATIPRGATFPGGAAWSSTPGDGPWRPVAAGVLLAGAALLALWLLSAQIVLMRWLRAAEAPAVWLAELFAGIRAQSGAGRGRLIICRRNVRPFSCGVYRPTVVLPRGLCRVDNRSQLTAVLRHELAHVERGDAWRKLLLAVALPVLYWNPLYWWLRRDILLCAELLADEIAARQTGRIEYVAELVSLARGASSAGPSPLCVTGVFSNTSQFSRRMQMVLQREQPLAGRTSTLWRTLACLVCASTTGMATLLTLASTLNAQERRTPAPSPGPERTAPSRSADEKAVLRARIAELTETLRQLEAAELPEQSQVRVSGDVELERLSGPLTGIRIEGNTTIAAGSILEKIESRAGRPPEARVIKSDIRALHQTRWFETIEPRIVQEEPGLFLVFKVAERPFVPPERRTRRQKTREGVRLPKKLTLSWTDTNGEVWNEHWTADEECKSLHRIDRARTGTAATGEPGALDREEIVEAPEAIWKALACSLESSWPFAAEVTYDDVRIEIKKTVDRVGESRFFPLVGAARVHRKQFQYTVAYDCVVQSVWPVPYSHRESQSRVALVDQDSLVRDE